MWKASGGWGGGGVTIEINKSTLPTSAMCSVNRYENCIIYFLHFESTELTSFPEKQ
jgi:hypothetical protein